MRKMFVASLLVAAGAMVLLTNPFPANAQIADDFSTINAKMKSKVNLGGSLARMNVSGPGDPDTTFIGHVHVAGARPAPYHGVAGGYGPFHIGSGPARYTQGSGSDLQNRSGMWTFDDFQAGETDSLQGWWPYRPNYPFGDVAGAADDTRPWWCLDYGNVTNYVINQGTANKRTFGVVGAWHRDPGSTIPGPGTSPVGWSPGGSASSVGVTGSNSAWCGLRAHGDLTAQDLTGNGGTGNYFNEDAGPMFGGRTPAQGATIKRFPGYNQQWDQMMYRDFVVPNGSSVTLAFRYRTRMSVTNGTNPTSISGWFSKDPLSKATGNFISASATLAGACGTSCPPIDSFMVYVGAPAENGVGLYSNTSPIGTIYDQKRRWFSEVLRVNEDLDGAGPLTNYFQMLSRAGNQPAANTDPTPTFSTVISDANLDQIRALGGVGDRFRVVFRVKTNRFFDDLVANAYNSEGRGAAVIDDVTLAGAFTNLAATVPFAAADGDFEAAGSINNDLAISSLAAWKSTGKPPAIYFHREQLDPLTYADICGDPGDPRRQCNMQGGIIKDGNEDDNDAGAGPFDPDAQPEMQWNHGIISPVVNLMSTGVGDYNAQGIDAELADTEGDINARLDEYYGRGDLGRYGALIQYGVQAYPATNVAGVKVWGEPRISGSGYFNPDQLCFGATQGNGGTGFKQGALLRTSNANGIPDSLRVIFHRVTLCQSFGVTTDCSAADGYYIDNISVELVDAVQPTISVSIWDFINDSFPGNEAISPASPAFDTTTAYIRSGLNIDPGTQDETAPNVPGDSVVVDAFGANRRVDMVFRIVPGPGNYVTKGNRLSGLRQVPTSATAAVANAASTNFWESYLGSNGTFGTAGGHNSPAGRWDPNVWNSARIDTSEANIFPVIARQIFAVDQTGGVWSSTYHDADPKFGTLGILKNRCFLQDTAGVTVDPNIDCDASGGTYPPAWTALVPASRTGYPGSPTTREHTKILPDGQFTPGTAVQYFFRASTIGGPASDFDMCPDTTIIFPQLTEDSNSDGHRWQQFGVLPDTWKEVQPVPFPGGGLGAACMLYVDNNDRRGNERMFISVADSIGLTSGARRGSHNGWAARGDFAYATLSGGSFFPVNVGSNDAVSVRPHYGQAGTVFDMYQVKASESINSMSGALGSRLSNRTPGEIGLISTYRKYSTHGPTPDMLREFYRILLVQTGDLNSGVWGPFADRSDDDWSLVSDFATVAGGTAQPRGVYLQGSGFVEYALLDESRDNPPFNHITDLNNLFNVDYADRSYTNISGVTANYIDLLAKNDIFPGGRIYGVGNNCTETNDVLTALPGATEASRYQGDAFTSGVKNVTATKITLLDGFNAGTLGTRPDGTTSAGSGGRIDYMYRALSNVFGALCPSWTPQVVAVGDNPITGGGAKFVNFLGLRSANPVRDRASVIVFGLAKTEPAEVRIYDVTGRLTKTLANRVFKGGEEHRLVWDGTNDAGMSVSRGVYFYQVRTPSYQSQKKLTVLAD